jgi:type III pantothenate kinase
LLIGNSRWHWAEASADGLRCWDREPPAAADRPPAESLQAWAAVGPLPDGGLPADRRLLLEAVPLGGTPPWLGIDRALAGWGGWRRTGAPVLVADAGTVLSLTAVDRHGNFVGGRLVAGLALQLRAMATGTERLPQLRREALETGSCWPSATDEAMLQGVRLALAAAITMAARERQAIDPGCVLLLTGGDATDLFPLVAAALGGSGLAADRQLQQSLQHCPWLCLEALAALRPHPAEPSGR